MNSLLLDSTFKELNVGLGIDGKLYKTSYECFQRQSELMIPEMDKLFKEHNVGSKEINEIVVTHGPGSYTGLRIALTIAKIYAFAVKCPCYSLSSLNVLIKQNVPTICLMNARSNRSYIGVYENTKCILCDQIMSNDDVKKYISEHKDYAVSGDLDYLGIEGYHADVLENMYFLRSDENKIENLLSLKATYLKD